MQTGPSVVVLSDWPSAVARSFKEITAVDQ